MTTALFFICLLTIPAAWFLSRQFDDAKRFFATWLGAAVIILCCLLTFFFRTVDEATGGKGGWGDTYKDIADGKFE